MTEPSVELLKKFQIKSGTRLWLINVPQAIAAALSSGAEVEPVPADEPFDGAIAFCRTPVEVESFAARILPRLPPDGLLWFAYRKGKEGKAQGLTRDVGWSALTTRGFETVRSIAIDEGWTGLRFRETGRINSKR